MGERKFVQSPTGIHVRLGRGLVFEDEIARVAGAADKDSRQVGVSLGS